MNLYRVRKTWFGRSILQWYHKAADSKYSGWSDVPYSKAPTNLQESWKNPTDSNLSDVTVQTHD